MARENTGSIQSVGDSKWLVRASGGYSVDGKQRRKSRTVYGSKKDAERALDALREELDAAPALGSKLTLDAYFSRFLHGRADLKAKTLGWYKDMWKHVPAAWRESELREPSNAEVQRWVSTLSPGTAKQAVRALRAVLRSAWYDDLLPSEPMRKPLRYPKAAKRRLEVWGVREIQLCLSFIDVDVLYPLVLVMAGGGLRREEALALRWEDISFEDTPMGYIAHLQIRDADNGSGDTGTKTDYSYRNVPLPPYFANRLHEIVKDVGPLALGRGGNPISPSTVPKHWRNLFAEGKPLESLPFIPFNRLRHTNSTLMQSAGVEDSVLAAYHGHTEIQTDYRHYLAPTSSAFTDAAMAYGRLFDS